MWEAAPRSVGVADTAPWVLQGHDDDVEVNAVVSIGLGLIFDRGGGGKCASMLAVIHTWHGVIALSACSWACEHRGGHLWRVLTCAAQHDGVATPQHPSSDLLRGRRRSQRVPDGFSWRRWRRSGVAAAIPAAGSRFFRDPARQRCAVRDPRSASAPARSGDTGTAGGAHLCPQRRLPGRSCRVFRHRPDRQRWDRRSVRSATPVLSATDDAAVGHTDCSLLNAEPQDVLRERPAEPLRRRGARPSRVCVISPTAVDHQDSWAAVVYSLQTHCDVWGFPSSNHFCQRGRMKYLSPATSRFDELS